MHYDRATSIFWLCISIVVAVASFRLGLGNVNVPGSGFTPFGASILLGILSIVCFFQSGGRKDAENTEPLFRGKFWFKVALVFLMLFCYTKILRVAGFILSTLPLLMFLFWVAGEKKPWKIILYALITTILCYYVFSRWLNLQFPAGPLGF